ncbi:hypothetical protein O181_021636 [Austropuccinia psidii MF-1]|uniref:Uncharacterized protein n=1 Tax=Austropuccinia psidii MF-1 TaxID=1389203 RepID=A0A9Q3CBD3_9BASI|nr:hypothetical protein [Austropuccinia psidii MF-1]
MDLDQDTQVINPKDKIVSPERMHKWKMPELPPVPKGLASTFYTLIESPEAEITAIPIVRPELFSTGNNRDIPVSVQELVYGSKEAGEKTSDKSLDRHNELISSSE